MKSNKNKKTLIRNIKASVLMTAILSQALGAPASAQEAGFDEPFSALQARQPHAAQFEIGISIPLHKVHSSRQDPGNATSLYASYYLNGNSRQMGLGFSRSFGRNPYFEYSTLVRDTEYDLDLSLPLYSAPVFNASSSGTSTGLSSTYLIAIGAGLLLLAAAGGSGGDDEETTPVTTGLDSRSATQRYLDLLALPTCSPIPPKDGNEAPCRTI